VVVLSTIQKNMNDNCEAQVARIELLKSGLQVEVTNLLGQKMVHPIRSLRKANDSEILAMHYKLGDVLAERMKTFFPVIVHSTGAEKDCIDIFWVDHQAPTLDKHLLSAILNGQEIDTSSGATGVDFRKDQGTIDV